MRTRVRRGGRKIIIGLDQNWLMYYRAIKAYLLGLSSIARQ